MLREHGDGSLKFGGVEGDSVNVWGSTGRRDSLEKGKEGVWWKGLARKRKISG